MLLQEEFECEEGEDFLNTGKPRLVSTFSKTGLEWQNVKVQLLSAATASLHTCWSSIDVVYSFKFCWIAEVCTRKARAGRPIEGKTDFNNKTIRS